jgi:hypothetical protein
MGKRGNPTNEATDFWPILVNFQELVRQFRELYPVVCDIEDIRINVDVIYSMRIECEDPLELLLGFAKVYTSSYWLRCVGVEWGHITVLVVQRAGPHTHDPRAHREEIFRQESLAELRLMVGRRSERVQRMNLEELDERMRSW